MNGNMLILNNEKKKKQERKLSSWSLLLKISSTLCHLFPACRGKNHCPYVFFFFFFVFDSQMSMSMHVKTPCRSLTFQIRNILRITPRLTIL